MIEKAKVAVGIADGVLLGILINQPISLPIFLGLIATFLIAIVLVGASRLS